jgi:hypothetical protein
VKGNVITGGSNGIDFYSENTTPGTTSILNNTVRHQSRVGIETAPGTKPLSESFIISRNFMSSALHGEHLPRVQ